MNKQIEEMAKIMQKCYEKNGLLNFKWFAESAYKYLTKDSVVLSKEEYEKLLACEHNLNIGRESYRRMEERAYATIEDLKNELKQARKETAREILNEIAHIRVGYNSSAPTIVIKITDKLLELAKQYGVEIKE